MIVIIRFLLCLLNLHGMMESEMRSYELREILKVYKTFNYTEKGKNTKTPDRRY